MSISLDIMIWQSEHMSRYHVGKESLSLDIVVSEVNIIK